MQLQVKYVIIEGDCLIPIDHLKRRGNISWDLIVTWNKLVKTLAQLDRQDVGYCRTEANTVADQLSKLEITSFAVIRTVLPHPVHGEYLKNLSAVASLRHRVQTMVPGSSAAAFARSVTRQEETMPPHSSTNIAPSNASPKRAWSFM